MLQDSRIHLLSIRVWWDSGMVGRLERRVLFVD